MRSVRRITNLDELYMFERSGVAVVHKNGARLSRVGLAKTTHIFIYEDDGDGFDIRFSVKFEIQDGHRVSVLFAGDRVSCNGYPVAIINYTIGESYMLERYVDGLTSGPVNGGIVVALLIVSLITGPPALLGIPLSCYFLFHKNNQRKALKHAITARLEQEVARLMAGQKFSSPERRISII